MQQISIKHYSYFPKIVLVELLFSPIYFVLFYIYLNREKKEAVNYEEINKKYKQCIERQNGVYLENSAIAKMANSINNTSKVQSNNSNNYLKGSVIVAFASQVDKDNLAKEQSFKRNTFDFWDDYINDPKYMSLSSNSFYKN